MSVMLTRRDATAATLAKYRARPFDWARRSTCIHMARFQLTGMGHRLPPLPPFRSMLGAKRALAARGAESVAELLDGLGLMRIAPAAMMLGDLAAVPGEGGMDALFVNIGGGELVGWVDGFDGGMARLTKPLEVVTVAWDAATMGVTGG